MATSNDYIATLKARLKDLDREHKRLDAEQRDVENILKRLGVELSSEFVATVTLKKKSSAKKSNTSMLIIEYVREHPGCQIVQVVDALENKVETQSKNKRKLIRATMATLKKRERLTVTPLGTVIVSGE